MRASVVVPTLGRPELLRRCLRALALQSASDCEILVADDGADLRTGALVDSEAAASPIPMRWIPVQGNHGPAAARNAGWRASRAPIIAFTDDDTVPSETWLEMGTQALERDAFAVAAWGSLEMPLPPLPTDYEKNAALLSTAEFVTANCFCRRDALERIDGLDEMFRLAWREDSDLHFSLLKAFPEPGRLLHVPQAKVLHPLRPAEWGVSLKQAKKAMYNALLYKKHPKHYRARIQSKPPWRYYASVAAAATAVWGLRQGNRGWARASASLWLALTTEFMLRRLRGTSKSPRHIAEMALTSALLPPLAVSWRLYGSFKFRVFFV